jgi:hypothetical protein
MTIVEMATVAKPPRELLEGRIDKKGRKPCMYSNKDTDLKTM